MILVDNIAYEKTLFTIIDYNQYIPIHFITITLYIINIIIESEIFI